MSTPRLLVIEGNTAEGRKRQVAAGGEVASERYGRLLNELWPEAAVDVCFPADPGANLPDGSGLESYDGVAITGSSLHVYDGGPAIQPQIEFVREVYRSKTPIFGSCWGLQVATVAAGGTVHKNPRGREIGIGRRIRVTEAGANHPMYKMKPPVFEALTVHLDEVESLPLRGKVLAMNDHSGVQAAEIQYEGGVAWGVQYHPEYNFKEISAILKRLNGALVTEGFFASNEDRLALYQGRGRACRRSGQPAARLASWLGRRRNAARHPAAGIEKLDRAESEADALRARPGLNFFQRQRHALPDADA